MIGLYDKATIIKAAALDDWGEPISGTELTYPCRISDKTEKVSNANGEEVVGKGSILFKGFVDVKYSDKVKFSKPDGTEAVEDPVNVSYKKDLGGNILFTKVVI